MKREVSKEIITYLTEDYPYVCKLLDDYKKYIPYSESNMSKYEKVKYYLNELVEKQVIDINRYVDYI